MCAFHERGIVCPVLSPQARNCNIVSVGTELCEHDLRGPRMMCLCFVQNFV